VPEASDGSTAAAAKVIAPRISDDTAADLDAVSPEQIAAARIPAGTGPMPASSPSSSRTNAANFSPNPSKSLPPIAPGRSPDRGR